jgi:hypothetical protein
MSVVQTCKLDQGACNDHTASTCRLDLKRMPLTDAHTGFCDLMFAAVHMLLLYMCVVSWHLVSPVVTHFLCCLC